MITKRIIPCLDVRDGRVVKGVNFEGLRDVSSPVSLAEYYSSCGADELVFYDITASSDGRKLFTDILTETAQKVFIPLTVGGGINSVDDFDRVLKCGADKVSVHPGAIRDPSLVFEAAKRYGDQCVVLSADVKRVDGEFRVFAKGGREDTGMEAIAWIKKCVSNGAGEIVVNSVDADGTRAGFELTITRLISEAVNVPVVASGGAGKPEHLVTVFEKAHADAAIVAGMYGEGRFFLSSDISLFAPLRIEHGNNAELLANVLGWLLNRPVDAEVREKVRANLFLTTNDFNRILEDER